MWKYTLPGENMGHLRAPLLLLSFGYGCLPPSRVSTISSLSPHMVSSSQLAAPVMAIIAGKPLRTRGYGSSSSLCSTSSQNSPVAIRASSNPSTHSTKTHFETLILKMQDSICQELAALDGSGNNFGFDKWQRGGNEATGYGITRVLEDGDLMEKAAANVSILNGQLSQTRAKAISARGHNIEEGSQYFAGALSLVFHPQSPHVPTLRADVRYFEVGGSGWFGGGADLTPCYLNVDDARYFHGFWKDICDKFHPALYSNCKTACDSYFYLPARKEHRGIGGIFFDDLESFDDTSLPDCLLDRDWRLTRKGGDCRVEVFDFVVKVAEGFLPSYVPIIRKNRTAEYGDREREWQLHRRGRYLEFNLLYDRGVKFGLDGGRIDSIMVSAPPLVAWKYNVTPKPNSLEAQMVEVLCTPREWI